MYYITNIFKNQVLFEKIFIFLFLLPNYFSLFLSHKVKLYIATGKVSGALLALTFVCDSTKPPERRLFGKMIMDKIALIITIIGALNWGSIGLFGFDIVAWLGGGMDALVSRIIYTVVALAGIWCITLLFRTREKFSAIGEME